MFFFILSFKIKFIHTFIHSWNLTLWYKSKACKRVKNGEEDPFIVKQARVGFNILYILNVRREVVLQSDQPIKWIWSVWSCKCQTICCISENCSENIREVWERDFALRALALESRAGPWKQLIQFSKQVLAADRQRYTCAAKPPSPAHPDKDCLTCRAFHIWNKEGLSSSELTEHRIIGLQCY